MFRGSRYVESPEADRWVYPKVILFLVGAALGIAGMVAHIDWLVTVALAVLGVAILLRWITRSRVADAVHDDGVVDEGTTPE